MVSRRRSLRHLLSRSQLYESTLLGTPASLRNAGMAGLQAGLSILIAMCITHFSAWSHLVAYTALGAMAALFGRAASYRRRHKVLAVSGLLLVIGVAIPGLLAYLGMPTGGLVLVLALFAGLFTLAEAHWRLGAPGAVIFVFAVGASMSPADSLSTLCLRIVATCLGAVIAYLVCIVTDRARIAPPDTPVTQHTAWARQLHIALRISLGAACSASLVHYAGWHHPAWAAIGAVAVMQGSSLHSTMNRSLQRMAGTVVGACLAWVILSLEPTFLGLAIAVVTFQIVTEIVIGFNYALGQVAITPMALLMTYMANPISSSTMPIERILDSIVGALIGIVFALLFSSADDRHMLHRRRRLFAVRQRIKLRQEK